MSKGETKEITIARALSQEILTWILENPIKLKEYQDCGRKLDHGLHQDCVNIIGKYMTHWLKGVIIYPKN